MEGGNNGPVMNQKGEIDVIAMRMLFYKWHNGLKPFIIDLASEPKSHSNPALSTDSWISG
jgi:hypothetical protein